MGLNLKDRRTLWTYLAVLLICVMVLPAYTQRAASSQVRGEENWDYRFRPFSVDAKVRALAVNGSDIYVGGTFVSVGDVVANRVARWDGDQWHSVGGGVSGGVGAVSALAVSGNDVYVGGNFTSAGGMTVSNIAKWDGIQWHSLAGGVVGQYGQTPHVFAIEIRGSDVYAGGQFTGGYGWNRTYISRWDGTRWHSLINEPTEPYGLSGAVYDIAFIGDDLIACGVFLEAGGEYVGRIARWDGAQWSPLGGGLNATAHSLAVRGSDLYVGGEFSMAGGVPVNHVAKWNGSQWSALGDGVEWVAHDLAFTQDGVLYAGTYHEPQEEGAYISSWDGIQWRTLGEGLNGPARKLAAVGNALYVGGEFTTAGGAVANYMALWNGTAWSPFGNGPGLGASDEVLAIHHSGQDTYVGGSFTTVGGIIVNNIARWDGAQWHPLRGGANDQVTSIATYGENVYIGGRFTAVDGIAANRVARWDGSQWSALGDGTQNSVYALAVGPNGELYAGGSFIHSGEQQVNYIIRWDGTQWQPLGEGVDDYVYAVAVDGSDVYVGGILQGAGGTPAQNIAKWNGSQWTQLGAGVNNSVRALAISGGSLYAGGHFTMTGGLTTDHIARWDGTQWHAVGGGTNSVVRAITVEDSDLYLGGSFTSAGGNAANYIVKWNGAQWYSIGNGTGGTVLDISIDGGDVYAGGAFSTAGGEPSSRFGIWHGPNSVTPTVTDPTTTPLPTRTPVIVTPTACPLQFSDVPTNSTFYPFVRCLACRYIVSGYADGTFRPNADVTRGQIAKIVSNAAGYVEEPGPPRFEDVPANNTFYAWINRLSTRGHIGGYACGGVQQEPCGPLNLPYFRPATSATRGQLAKIVSSAAGFNETPVQPTFADVPSTHSFYAPIERLASRGIMGGYACGGVGEPCDPQARPYFRPQSNVTRGQTTKIVAGAFYPACVTP